MRTLASSVLQNPYVVYAGWVLLVILWHTTAVAIALEAWRSWRPGATARESYRAATFAFAFAVLLAMATPTALYVMSASVSRPSMTATAAVAPSAVGPESGGMGTQALVAGQSAGAGSREAPVSELLAASAAVVWAACVVLLLLRLAGGWLVAAAVRRRATLVETDHTLAAFARVTAELQVRSPVQLLQSDAVEAPVVIGVRRPAIILPSDAALRLPAGTTELLLAHELEHVKRRDYLLNLLQSVAEAVLFFSVGVVWMSRRIRELREYCCDDAAVARCGDVKRFVQALTMLASWGTLNTTRPALGAAGPRLVTRVRRLVQGEVMPQVRTVKLAATAALLSVVAVTGVRVAAATAGRAPRPEPMTGWGASVQETVPYGYATEQEGSGVVLSNFASTSDAPAQQVTVANVTNQRIVGLRFVAAVERWGRGGPRQPVRLFVSDRQAVSIAPGEKAPVAPAVLTAQHLADLWAETPEMRMQLFFGVTEVVYENGVEWRITANASATTGRDALSIPTPFATRAWISRDAQRGDVPFGACRDDRGRAFSHGAFIGLLNEPGAGLRCQNGRWVERR